MAEDLKLYIAGEWTQGSGDAVHELVSPATGEVIAAVPLPGLQDVDRAVKAANGAVEALRDMGPWERAAMCHRLADLIDQNKDELGRIQTLEQGKPLFSESIPEIEEAAENFRIAAEDIKRLTTDIIPSRDPNKRIFTFRKSLGTLASITPWNFPLLIPAEHIAPALAAGNAIVSKPPEFTSWTLLKFAELCDEAGVPKGAISVLPGGSEVGEALVTHAGVDAIAFIGSSLTGERIVSQAGLKRTFMELSGNGPVIVLDDASIQRAAEGAVLGAYYCAGQVCCATERVIVLDGVHDQFVEATLKAAEVVRLGDPLDPDTTMGPMTHRQSAEKMDRHIADARDRGADVLRGGGRAQGFPTDLYYDFTVVDGVTPVMAMAREESFGPVVPIIRARDDAEALRIANDDALGLQAAVYTTSLSRAFWFADRLNNGNVVVNDHTDYWEPHEPFGGGAGTRSGWGRIGGIYTMHDLTDLRTMVVDLEHIT